MASGRAPARLWPLVLLQRSVLTLCLPRGGYCQPWKFPWRGSGACPGSSPHCLAPGRMTPKLDSLSFQETPYGAS